MHTKRTTGKLLLLAAILLCGARLSAQYAERGSTLGSRRSDVDCSGRSVKNPRTRAVHSVDPARVGGSGYFTRRDPYLAYQLGRNLCFREFRKRDGVFDAQISNLAGPMVDRATAKITANNQTSCSGCHNQPYGNPGGGASFAKDSGRGRQTPHYFGAGIVEMLAIQVREKIMLLVDANGDGWISVSESAAAPPSIELEATPGGGLIDYGSCRLTNGTTGQPQLNHIFRFWYGKASDDGIEVVEAAEIDGVRATHYNFAMVVWGWGQRVPPSALNPTNRAFLWDPWKAHGGLESHDPSTLDDPDGDGVSEATLAGAMQFPATHRAPDPGDALDPLGFSRDDPDGDGYLTEISEGDLDLAEWFLLNTPRPAFAGTPKEYRTGLRLMKRFDCTGCHVADWKIEARDAHFAGDRRVFDLDVTWNEKQRRLEGRLVELFEIEGDESVRDFGAFEVRGIFSDLRHHDMGEGLLEIGYDGAMNTVWRTTPLWGVGSGFPWGHDGASLTLEDAIRRHGGAAEISRSKFEHASRTQQRDLIEFLQKLQLYDIESLPTDLDGDGQISDHFLVAGMDTGVERFNPEWLFRTPVRIQGTVVNADGLPVRSFAATNLEAAYGLDLELRVDSDLDGWPDVWDREPLVPGFKDGVSN